MKKLNIFLVGLIVVLAGCGSGSSDTSEAATADSSEISIGFSISTLTNPFFNTVTEYSQQKAEELGATMTVVDAQDDSAKQMTDIEDLAGKGVDVMIINPVDSDAIVSSVEMLNEKDIPVITVDRSSNGGEVASSIVSDNVKGGEIAGEYAVDLLGGSGNVIMIDGIPGASAQLERSEGFEKAIDGKLTILDRQTANFDRAEALSVMEDLISAHGDDIDLVFALNDEMALGAEEALRSAGMEDVPVIGFDGTQDVYDSIAEGGITATIQQQPQIMGELSAEYAVDLANGKEVESEVPVEVKLVDASNLPEETE